LERLFIAAVPLIKRHYCPGAVYTGNGIQDRDIFINMTTGSREGRGGPTCRVCGRFMLQ